MLGVVGNLGMQRGLYRIAPKPRVRSGNEQVPTRLQVPFATFEEAIEVSQMLNNIARYNYIKRASQIEALCVSGDNVETLCFQDSHPLLV